jgi:glycosyltransferase involved in cell wall biosynthesis
MTMTESAPAAARGSGGGGPAVSVVVAARNGAHQLPALFAALERQTLPRDRFEVIVVDDGSSDRTAAVAEASGLARVIRSDVPVGVRRARNLGIRAARGDLVAITDADTVPDPTWLELGLARMDESGADMIGGGVSIDLGDDPSIAALVDAMNWLNQERCVEQGFALTANVWARRDAFETWGYFNEGIESHGHEDVEWGQRATRGGARLVYAPDVHVSHPPRARMREVRSKAYRHGFGLAPYRRLPDGAIKDMPPLFLRPTPYLPPRHIELGRLRELGHEPTRVEIGLLYASQWLFVIMPRIAGDFMGELQQARRRLRARL